MKMLFIVSSSKMGFWLSELTHPFWHLAERGHEIEIASPAGGQAIFDPTSDPYADGSWEKNDLVSKGFLSDEALVSKLSNTTPLANINPELYDGVHIVGGGGAAVDLYPNGDVARILEHFWEYNKVIGAICHGAIALANNPSRVKGRTATGFSRKEDGEVEKLYGANFIPNFPQPVMEEAGINFVNSEPWQPRVVVDAKLVTGQNQFSASEYGIVLNHVLMGESPITAID